MTSSNRYSAIVEAVFVAKYEPGASSVDFKRDDLVEFANRLEIELPKNLGDIVYSFRYRADLPSSILEKAPRGKTWIIRSAGRAQYRFVLVADTPLVPNPNLSITRIPDSTPGLIMKYAFSDEQALLARVRYNRLIDVFLGVACWSLQNHLRTTVKKLGQIETDEVYVGIDKKGCHYVIPVQAKSGNDRLSRIQIEQDIDLCETKMSSLICRPVGVHLMQTDLIAMFEFEAVSGDIKIVGEQHYRLVAPEDVTDDDLARYQRRLAPGD